MPLRASRLDWALVLLVVWFGTLCWALVKLLKDRSVDKPHTRRRKFTVAATICSAVAVASLTGFHVSWLSPAASQHVGMTGLRLLATFLFWPAVAGFLLGLAGSGSIRFLPLGTSLMVGIWWFTMSLHMALGGAPMIRYPERFMIPEGYVGQVEIKYGVATAPPLPLDHGTRIYQIPDDGVLITSSLLQNGWAHDEYFYYSAGGSVRALSNVGGTAQMIWNPRVMSADGAPPDLYLFYVGSQQQAHDDVNGNDGRP